MTPDRLAACLNTIRWPPSTLAQCLEADGPVVEGWLNGSIAIPVNVASWVEALCFTHEASDLMRPSVASGSDDQTGRRGARAEHIPIYSYGLLRQVNHGPVALSHLYGTDDEAAVVFLVSRGLAERDGDYLTITPAGAELGAIVSPRTEALGA